MTKKRIDSVARRLAAQMWGLPDKQRKLADGIWLFCAESRSGIIIDTKMHPEILEFFERTIVLKHKRNANIRPSEQHFVALQEGPDAYVAEWIYAKEILTPNYRMQLATTVPYPEWKKKRLEMIRNSRSIHHPNVLKIHPVCGKEKKE